MVFDSHIDVIMCFLIGKHMYWSIPNSVYHVIDKMAWIRDNKNVPQTAEFTNTKVLDKLGRLWDKWEHA